MTTTGTRTLRIKVVAVDPPFESGDGVVFGLQGRTTVDDPTPADRTSTFVAQVDVVGIASAGVDFRGEHVQGRKGERFLYLSWGLSGPGEPFAMFARAKIKLVRIPPELIERVAAGDLELICELSATNRKGQRASGSIAGGDLRWRTSP